MAGEFTNKLIEMHQRVVIDLQTHINVLTERNHALEQVVKDALEWMASQEILVLDARCDDARAALVARAKALLGEESK